MSELDELLARVKAEYQKKKERPEIAPPVKTPSSDRKSSTLDRLLAEAKAQFESEKNIEVSPVDRKEKASVTDDLITDVKTRFALKQTQPPQNPESSRVIANLQELQARYRQKQQADLEQNRIQQLKDIQIQEERRVRRQQALELRAREWLKQLDPHSDEGFWFEQFANSYDSKLQAAIEYLEALETNPSGSAC